jgi:glycosyltransferase involved in cell wall biosynthesis
VIHLNDYPAARLAQAAAKRSRVVIVFHGRGLGRFDEHLARADRLVVLREDAAQQLRLYPPAAERVAVLTPSVDLSLFHPREKRADADLPLLGYVGRLEASKGVLEIPPTLRALVDRGIDAYAELAGAATPRQRADLDAAAAHLGVRDRLKVLGDLTPAALGERMRNWRLLLLPSYTEGFPLVALEAGASRIPVAAVAGVLPAELEKRPGISVAPRQHYAHKVVALLDERMSAPEPDWVLGHEEAATMWDAVLEEIPPRRPAPLEHANIPDLRVVRLRRERATRLARRLVKLAITRPIGNRAG